ncbi:MAG: D-glycerate dehydrogenase [Novosphingobium sp.]|uniref:2-hydroxyacid dehydrogenase n=1 Tax=Novosphingobium sp. TaxID=1874826 RepID=UPI0032B77AE7
MSIKVLTTRPLPLPPLKSGDEDIEFVVLGSGDPTGARSIVVPAIDRLDAAAIAQLPASVGLIANIGVGVDNLDLAAAAARGIAVSNTPVVTEDTADLALALLLAAARGVARGDRYVRAGSWSAGEPWVLGQRVSGATLGLVGFGAIAQAVARRAAGFGMKVLYWNRSAQDDAAAALGATRCANLDELLGQADFVSVHLPLTPETDALIGAARLAAMKPGAVLINTARGAVVDETALIEALHSGHLAAAGLDVFAAEPTVPVALLAMDQVVLTPHIGSATAACRTDMVMRALNNLLTYLGGGTPPDRLPAP